MFGLESKPVIFNKIQALRIGVSALALFTLASMRANAAVSDFDVFNYYARGSSNPSLVGRLFVPENYDPDQSYPIFVYYHGAGRVGTDNTRQVGGPIENLLVNAKDRDFFIYAPQTPTAWSIQITRITMQMLSNATRTYNIDLSRMYVTGNSLGGSAVWNALFLHHGAINGGVPSAGILPSVATEQRNYSALVGKPIWGFHAINDTVVSPGSTLQIINDIREADGKSSLSFLTQDVGSDLPTPGTPYYPDGSYLYAENNLRFTQYSSGGHGIANRLYSEGAMYDWLFSLPLPVSTSTLQVGETLLFDFGSEELTATDVSAVDSLGRFWNSSIGGLHSTIGAVLPFGLSSAGRGTTVSLDVSEAFASQNSNGSDALYDSGIGTDGWNTGSGGTGTMVIRGLEPGTDYRLDFYGSTSAANSVTRYQADGQFVDLETTGNQANTAMLGAVTADAQGWIEVTVAPAPGSASGQINTLRITPSASPNQAPIVVTGSNQTVTLPDTVSLAGLADDDGLPVNASVSAQWSLFSGPGQVTFSAPTDLSTSASFSAPGTYILRLTVNDTELSSVSDVQITVLPEGTLPSTQIYFDFGSPDYPSEGTWNNVSSRASGVRISNALDVNTSLTGVSLSIGGIFRGENTNGVTSGGPYVGTATQDSFYNQAGDTGLIELAGLDPDFKYTLTFYAARSTMTANRETSYTAGGQTVVLDAADNVSDVAVLSEIAPDPGGNLTIQIENNTGSGFGYIGVLDVYGSLDTGNSAPVVDAGPDQNLELPTLTANLTGIVTDDGMPEPVSLTTLWSQESGPGTVSFGDANALSTTAVFPSVGEYVLNLTADDGERSSSDSVTVVVYPEGALSNIDLLFDFGISDAQTSGNWNNVTSPQAGLKIDGAINVNGIETAVSLSVESAFTGTNNNGVTSGGLYDGTATEDSFFVTSPGTSSVVLGGLDSSFTYTLTFYASRSNTSANRLTTYTVNGQSVDLDVANNAIGTAVLSDVIADLDGTLTIEVQNTTGSGFGYLGVLEVNGAANEEPASELSSWRELQGLAADGSQDLLTPAGDGVSNLLKFAFNMAPQAGDILVPNVQVMAEDGTRGLPFMQLDETNHLTITFVRIKDSVESGVTYEPVVSSDLRASWTTMMGPPAVTSIDAIWERVTYTDSEPSSVLGKRFVSVRVIRD